MLTVMTPIPRSIASMSGCCSHVAERLAELAEDLGETCFREKCFATGDSPGVVEDCSIRLVARNEGWTRECFYFAAILLMLLSTLVARKNL